MSNKLENEMNLNNNYGLNIILNSLKNFLTTKIENLDFSANNYEIVYKSMIGDFIEYQTIENINIFDDFFNTKFNSNQFYDSIIENLKRVIAVNIGKDVLNKIKTINNMNIVEKYISDIINSDLYKNIDYDIFNLIEILNNIDINNRIKIINNSKIDFNTLKIIIEKSSDEKKVILLDEYINKFKFDNDFLRKVLKNTVDKSIRKEIAFRCIDLFDHITQTEIKSYYENTNYVNEIIDKFLDRSSKYKIISIYNNVHDDEIEKNNYYSSNGTFNLNETILSLNNVDNIKIIFNLFSDKLDEEELIKIACKNYCQTDIFDFIINNTSEKVLMKDNNKLFILALDNGYKFSINTPNYIKQNPELIELSLINSKRLFQISSIIDNISKEIVTKNNNKLFILALNKEYEFSNKTPDYIKQNPELIELAIINSKWSVQISYIIDNISKDILMANNNKLLILGLSKGYIFSDKTPNWLKNNLELIEYCLKTFDIFNINKLVENVSKEILTTNDNKLLILALSKGYIFNNKTPDWLKNDRAMILLSLKNGIDINSIILNIDQNLFMNEEITKTIINKFSVIDLKLFMKIKEKLNLHTYTPEIEKILKDANKLIDNYGKVNVLNNKNFQLDLIKYIYPIFGTTVCINLLKFNSSALMQISKQIKNGKVEVIKYYYNVIIPLLFDLNDSKTIHYSFRYFNKFEQLISSIIKENYQLTHKDLNSLKSVIYTGNKYEINTIFDLKNYNSIIKNKYQEILNSDNILTVKNSIAHFFGFDNSTTISSEIANTPFEFLKLAFNNFQLGNFSKINFLYNSLKKSKIISEDDLNKIMFDDYDIKIILLMKEIIETDNIDELKEILKNFINHESIIFDYSVNVSEIIYKIRSLYNLHFQTKLTKIDKLDNLKIKNKKKIIRKYKNLDDNIGYLEEVSYEIIDFDCEKFDFLGHLIHNYDPEMKNFMEMLLKKPELWTKIDGSSTLSTSTLSDKGFFILNSNDNSGVIYLFNNLTDNFMLFMFGKDLITEYGSHLLEPTSCYNWFTDLDGLNQSSLYHHDLNNEVSGFREGMMPCAIGCLGEEPNDDQIRAASYFKIPIIRFNIKAYKDICIKNFKNSYNSFKINPSFENLENIFLSGDIGDYDIGINEKFEYCFAILKQKLQSKQIKVDEFLSMLSYIQQLIDRICDGFDENRKLIRKIELYKETYSIVMKISEDKVIDLENASIGESGVMFQYNDNEKEYLLKPAVDKIEMHTQNFRAEIQKAAAILQKIISSDTYVPVEIIENGIQKISKQEKLQLSDNTKQLKNWIYNDERLDQSIANQLLQEYVVDFLICNFDCFYGNFIIDRNNNLRGIDKEQSFKFIDNPESLKPDFSFIPNGDSRIPIYKILFEKYNNNQIDLDFSYFDKAVKKIENITDQEYREIFKNYAKDLNPYRVDEILDKIIDRKHKSVILMKEYIESIKNNCKKNGGINL